MYYLKNPKKDSLTLFRYQPAKRFAHIPRSNEPPSAPESKRKKLDTSNEKVTEDMMENLEKYIEPHEKESLQYSKSIKWRSPLIYSPPVKFSPKIPSTFSFSVPMPRNIDSENSHDWSLNTVETNHSSKTVRSLAGTTPVARKNESQNQGTKFLLSDREYNVAEKPLNNNNNNQNMSVVQTPQKSRQLQDFFSSSFLEDIGYSEKQKMTSNLRCFSQKKQDLNTSVQSAGSYYHDMVAKDTQEQRNNEALKLSQKPFFLNQNHLSLSENKNSDFGGIANSSQRLDQTFNQRSFAPQNIPMVPDRSIPTQAMNFMGPQSMGSHWTHEGHNNSSGNFPRPEFNLTGRNIAPNESSRNLWHTNSNFKNQYDPTLSSQRMPKYLPESREDIHYNPEHNQLQSLYTKPTNNYTKDITTFGINRPSEIPQMDQTMSNLMASQHEYGTGNFDSSQIPTFPQAYHSQYAKNRLDFDREHSNYQMLPNVPSLNQNQGFFLNQTPYPQFHGPNMSPLWNTFCMVHKMFHCHFCLNQNYAMRPNMNMLNGQHGFSRSKSFNGTSSYPAAAPENQETEGPKEYLNSSSFVPYNQQYVNGINRDNSFMQNVGITGPYGLENYVQPNNNTLGYGSDSLNKFGRQALNIPSEMMYQNFIMPDSNESQMTMRENSSNKDFMISKFLNSFDDSMKNQK